MSDLTERVAAVPFWWHSIELGDGVVTPGNKTPEFLTREVETLCLPDLAGKTVLDIGAWDGYFSFLAERQGATRVVALDHYVWQAEWCGPSGFLTARDALGSNVERVEADFMTMDLDKIGTFDIVFYFGVLYHIRHPLLALERVAQVTRGMAVIETQAIAIPGLPDFAGAEFYETTELRSDDTNWWAVTSPALTGMCRAAGFDEVELIRGAPDEPADDDGVQRYVAVTHAYKR